jgi:hypothetical protein
MRQPTDIGIHGRRHFYSRARAAKNTKIDLHLLLARRSTYAIAAERQFDPSLLHLGPSG